MQSFRTTRKVAHSAEEMFSLVADVERYPAFLPLCEGMKVRRREVRDGKPVFVADMTIAYKMLRETFTSRVMLDHPQLTIRVEYVDGPFKHLENRWVFRPTGPHACEVDFFIEWELRSRTLGLVVGAVFERVFRRYAEAFEARADEVYGRAALAPQASAVTPTP
jgi:coenzyme Q-binding protein COQ10